MYSAHLPGTPLGTLRLWGTDEGLRRLDFSTGPDLALPGERLSTDPLPAWLEDALDALRAYLAGRSDALTTGRRSAADGIPLDLGTVTPFQQKVYDRLIDIPPGEVATYGKVAEDIGEPGAARAVGQAVGANPVAIVIPCHRVVASDGTLHGYGGGLERKARLLELEGVDVDGDEASSRVHPEVLRLPF